MIEEFKPQQVEIEGVKFSIENLFNNDKLTVTATVVSNGKTYKNYISTKNVDEINAFIKQITEKYG